MRRKVLEEREKEKKKYRVNKEDFEKLINIKQ